MIRSVFDAVVLRMIHPLIDKIQSAEPGHASCIMRPFPIDFFALRTLGKLLMGAKYVSRDIALNGVFFYGNNDFIAHQAS